MTAPRLALADELASIRAEIDRLQQRETALASIEHAFPKVPVFRRAAMLPRSLELPAPGPHVHA